MAGSQFCLILSFLTAQLGSVLNDGLDQLQLNVSVVSPDSALLSWDQSDLQEYLQLEAVFSYLGGRSIKTSS